jgi:hypothetical protein
MSAPLQLLVDFVEQHVCEQRREWSTLRRSLVPFHHDPVRHDSGVEVAADEPQYATVLHSFAELAHQHVVVHAVEEFLQVHVGAPHRVHDNTELRFPGESHREGLGRDP